MGAGTTVKLTAKVVDKKKNFVVETNINQTIKSKLTSIISILLPFCQTHMPYKFIYMKKLTTALGESGKCTGL